MSDLGILEPLVGQVLTSLIYVYIENYIQKTCKDSYDVSYVEHLEKVISSFEIINKKLFYSVIYSG